MSALAEKVEVICPKCGEEFGAWYRPPLDPAMSSTCPQCRHDLARDISVREDAPWAPAPEDLEPLER